MVVMFVVVTSTALLSATVGAEQLTDNDVDDLFPRMNDSGGYVVWYAGVESPDYDIFLYDGTTTTRLTNDDVDEDVDDDRESPSYMIKNLLEEKGYLIRMYDPLVTDDLKSSSEFLEVTEDADCLILVTDHQVFMDIDPQRITNMRSKNLLDTRNLLNHTRWEQAGFRVSVLGM